MVQGRHSEYTPEIAKIICDRMSEGETLRAICRDEGMPVRATVCSWLLQFPDFLDQYRKARDIQSDQFADMIIEVAFDNQGDTYADEYGNPKPNYEVINRSKLKVDALKWHASKTAPKKYGDKIEQTHVGDETRPMKMDVKMDIENKSSAELLNFILSQGGNDK